MKSGLVTMALTCCCLASSSPRAAAPADETEEMLIKDVKVILKQNLTNETISAQLYVKGGSLNLEESNQGIEPFIFRSVTLKDRKYAEKSWSKIIEGTGAEMGSASDKNYTVVSLRCTREYFDQLWVMFSDYVMKTTFYDERVEIARERMLSEIKQREDSPDVYIRELAEELFYSGHPYGLNANGVEETIAAISMRQMRSHQKEILKKARLLLVVVGNVEKADLIEKVSKTFGKLSKGKYEAGLPPAVHHTQPNLKIVERDLPTNYLLGLFSIPAPTDPNYYAATIAIQILKSRLFEEIRTKRNLSYAPDAFMSNNLANYGGIYATSDQPDSTVKIMSQELKKLQTETVDPKELRDRINMYITSYYLSNQSNAAQGRFLALLELSGLGWQESERIVERLRGLTVADVQLAAQQYFNNLQFVYLGNPELIEESLFKSM